MVDGIDGIKLSQGLALGLGDFDLIRVIGRGSYAKVLLVRLKKNKQVYAMKVVKKELVHDDEVRHSGHLGCPGCETGGVHSVLRCMLLSRSPKSSPDCASLFIEILVWLWT